MQDSKKETILFQKILQYYLSSFWHFKYHIANFYDNSNLVGICCKNRKCFCAPTKIEDIQTYEFQSQLYWELHSRLHFNQKYDYPMELPDSLIQSYFTSNRMEKQLAYLIFAHWMNADSDTIAKLRGAKTEQTSEQILSQYLDRINPNIYYINDDDQYYEATIENHILTTEFGDIYEVLATGKKRKFLSI